MNAYITSTGAFLPGPPIDNDEIEEVLGYVHGKPSRLKQRVLKSNGIKTRHYAINKHHHTLFNNSELAANAGLDCCKDSYLSLQQVEMLSCATSQGDVILPGFGSMVQAKLDLADVELHTSHGICCSGMMALKAAYTGLLAGEHANALVIASELSSRLFKASRYEAVATNNTLDMKNAPDFNAEFLRWMLSDGAGAMLLESQPRNSCYKIEWIRGFSHANAYPVCMGIGNTADNQQLRNWQDYANYGEAEAAGALVLRQDVRLLDNIVKLGVDGFLRLLAEGKVSTDKIDHVLCHFSSEYFRSRIFDMLEVAGASIPEQKWYTNLYTRGNTGCASIFIMLDEFRRTQAFSSGQQILCMVPESGRFNTVYMLLTVAEA